MTISPFSIFEVTAFVPTTAGISMERAMMAECDVLPPISVVNPLTYSRFN